MITAAPRTLRTVTDMDMVEFVTCPEDGCGLPSQVDDRFVLESTDGPVEHVRISCVGRHRFCMPTALLPGA